MKLPTDEELHAAAKARYERDSRTHPNHRPLTRGLPYGHWLAALMGERLFAETFNVPMKMELLPSGDGHIDFVIGPPNRLLSVDVKTSTWQGPNEYMLVEVKEQRDRTAYVSANHDFSAGATKLNGWMVGEHVRVYPVGCLKGQTIRNYNVPVGSLWPIRLLVDWCRP